MTTGPHQLKFDADYRRLKPTNEGYNGYGLRSPFSISQTDIALRRRFRLTERVTLDFRAEYFNLFNHPMFGGPFGPVSFWGYCDWSPFEPLPTED